ncbi:MAG: GIY-YIG nuclease family protein [Chloroflexi bacterium]|jgi:putative endonuclease|nr:MAG: GIY-YIG nuclease family protein [Chloroflexota bacterium]RLT53085.1 MAG: GIY-YIG nuclease family protein [Chloroflexota bacterium]
MAAKAFVYIVRCADNTLYTGWTTDVERRVRTHNAGRGAQYTRRRMPVELVYLEPQPSRADAMRREAAIKRWPRKRKLALAHPSPARKRRRS